MSKTIIILPETEGPTLCVSLTGIIAAEDFSEFFEKPLREVLNRFDHYNLYAVYQEEFRGWSEEAADLSFKCISAVASKAKKAAYVNAPDSRRLLMKMVQPLTSAEVRYFDSGEESQALAWIRE
ncbi:MAG: hypothetical protein JWO78_868 [Micavibrio sp.]|nr:hypothetical protein [Micavibrio sp.]